MNCNIFRYLKYLSKRMELQILRGFNLWTISQGFDGDLVLNSRLVNHMDHTLRAMPWKMVQDWFVVIGEIILGGLEFLLHDWVTLKHKKSFRQNLEQSRKPVKSKQRQFKLIIMNKQVLKMQFTGYFGERWRYRRVWRKRLQRREWIWKWMVTFRLLFLPCQPTHMNTTRPFVLLHSSHLSEFMPYEMLFVCSRTTWN